MRKARLFCFPGSFELVTVTSKPMPLVTMDDIIQDTCDILGVNDLALVGKTRIREVVEARQIAIYMAKKYLPKTALKRIGKRFNRDHSTVIYAISQYRDLTTTDNQYRNKANLVMQHLNKKLYGIAI